MAMRPRPRAAPHLAAVQIHVLAGLCFGGTRRMYLIQTTNEVSKSALVASLVAVRTSIRISRLVDNFSRRIILSQPTFGYDIRPTLSWLSLRVLSCVLNIVSRRSRSFKAVRKSWRNGALPEGAVKRPTSDSQPTPIC